MKPYYQKDNITIYNGDYLEVLKTLDLQVASFITDPPFGINYQNNYTHSIHDKLEGDQNYFSYKSLGEQAFRLLKPNSSIFVFTCWSEYPHHYNEIKESGFLLKEPLIVQKRASGTTDLYGSFQTNSDWIMFAHKGRFKFNKTNLLKNKKAGVVPNKGRKPVPDYKTRFPSCWFGNFPWSTENPGSIKKWRHPTVKNSELIRWLILLSTNENDIIIDPFMGTGSTLIAGLKTNRKVIGIELEEKYCKIAVDRLNDSYTIS